MVSWVAIKRNLVKKERLLTNDFLNSEENVNRRGAPKNLSLWPVVWLAQVAREMQIYLIGVFAFLNKQLAISCF